MPLAGYGKLNTPRGRRYSAHMVGNIGGLITFEK